MNILVLAAFISPTKGSEYSVGWNYVKHMSKYNNLTVVYGASGDVLGDCSEMKQYDLEHPMPHVKFVAVHASKTTHTLNYLNRKGIFPYSFYVAFKSWQKQAYQVAMELMETEHFDLCHMVGPIGYREPGYFWKLGLPYMWGPVGGANNSPWALVRHLPWKGRLKHIFRSSVNTLQMYSSGRVKKALRATDLLLTATTENQRKFYELYGKESIYLPENCIDAEIRVNEEKYCRPDTYNFIIVGRQDDSKNSLLFLRSLTYIKDKRNLHVDVVGDGPAREALQEFSSQNGLDKIITWHGQLPRAKAIQLFNNAHIQVITSISEGNPTTIWEAMSYGVPTLSLDHCGMHDTIDDESGIRIPIHSYEQCVKDIARAIENLLEHPARFKHLSEGVVRRAEQYTWNKRELVILDFYRKTIDSFNKHSK
uniref:glycosyltransferase family 4 protein n=1 Tax=Bacteroides uniformis TaxID=820 RepID=UPI0040294878